MEDRTGLYILLALLGITVVGVVGFALWSSGAAGSGIVSTPCKKVLTDFSCDVQLDYSHKFKKGQKVKAVTGGALMCGGDVCTTISGGNYVLQDGDIVTVCSDYGILVKHDNTVYWYVCGLRVFDSKQNKWVQSNNCCGWIPENKLTEA